MRDQFNLTGDFRDATLHIGPSTASGRVAPEPTVAWTKFGELPLGSVPERSALPAGSVMPWPPNALFVARDEALMAMARAFAHGGRQAVCRTVALGGIGGIGKTQLAVEFAHRYGTYFLGGVYWISCRDPQSMTAQVAACGRADALDLSPDFLQFSVEDQARLVAETWRAPYPRLLIFDNCEDEQTLSQWRPRSGGSRLLITSRRPQWSGALGVAVQPIAVLPRHASIHLLGANQPSAAEAVPVLNEIAAELGDLPLALHLAGFFLARYRHSPLGEPAHYLRQLRSLSLSHPSLEAGDWSPTGHEQHVAKTFELSYRELNTAEASDVAALSILGQMACLAPDTAIPRDMIQYHAEGQSEDARLLAKEVVIRRLSDLGLIEEQGRELAMHRLIATYVRSTQGPDVQALVETNFLTDLARWNSGEGGLDGPSQTRWEVHLNHVVSEATRHNSPRATALLAQAGLYLYTQGNYHNAIELLRQRLRQVESDPQHDPGALSVALSNLAVSLRPIHPEESVSLLRRSLTVGQDASQVDPEFLITVYTNLGWALSPSAEAATAFDAANVLLEKHAAKIPPGRAAYWRALRTKVLNGLAQCYETTDRKRAVAMLEHALKDLRMEDADASDAELLGTLGVLRYRAGNLIGAKESLESAVRFIEQHVGDRSPLLADPLLTLGMTYRKLRQAAAARGVLERAMALSETMVGPAHTNTLLAARTLGEVLIDLGEFRAAHALLKQTIRRLDASDVSNNETLVALLFMYGLTGAELEGPAEARRHVKRALTIARAHNLRDAKQALTTLLRRIDSQGPVSGGKR